MKIVVIGGSGLIGRQVVAHLAGRGHEAVSASPSTGVNVLTGQGLAEVLAGADVVVDVSNAPSFEDAAVLDFFTRSGRTLLAAEVEAGVAHHVALSIVGTDRLPGNGYFRAKVAQEELIRASGVPFTIVRATQFFEFIGAITEAAAADGRIRVPDADFQPIAAADVAAILADVAVAEPAGGLIEIAGPDKAPFADFVARHAQAKGDRRPVSAAPESPYFGARLTRGSLVPDAAAAPRLGATRFAAWLSRA